MDVTKAIEEDMVSHDQIRQSRVLVILSFSCLK